MKTKFGAVCLAILLIAGMLMPCYAEDAAGGTFTFTGMCMDGEGILCADTYNNVIWRIEGGSAVVVAGQLGVPDSNAYVDGKADEARFTYPWAIAPYLNGYAITDAIANVVRYFDGENVQTIAGTGQAGKEDGYGTSASFCCPTGLAAGPNGSLFVADTVNGTIRKISSSGYVETVYQDLNEPTGICYVNGVLYIAETGLNRVIKIENGQRSVVAGGDHAGFSDGPVEKGLLSAPLDVVVSEDGSVYIADAGNSAVRWVKDGRITTFYDRDETLMGFVQPCCLMFYGDLLLISDAMGGLYESELDPPRYTDVDANSSDSVYIIEAIDRSLMQGTSEDEFSPSQLLTRAQLAVMLGRMYRNMDCAVIIDGDEGFPDVPADAWYAHAVCWAKEAGLIQGNGELFFPEGTVTRKDVLTVFNRFANAYGLDASAYNNMFETELSEAEANAAVNRKDAAQIFVEFMDFVGI